MADGGREILHAVKSALEGDATLAGYVKSFGVGELDSARKVFPFVTVGNLECAIEPRTIGVNASDTLSYTMEIRAGVRNASPGEAFGGEQGILQLCEDVVSAVRPNDFGIFDAPVEVSGVYPGYKADSGGTEWVGSIAIRGSRKAARA